MSIFVLGVAISPFPAPKDLQQTLNQAEIENELKVTNSVCAN